MGKLSHLIHYCAIFSRYNKSRVLLVSKLATNSVDDDGNQLSPIGFLPIFGVQRLKKQRELRQPIFDPASDVYYLLNKTKVL